MGILRRRKGVGVQRKTIGLLAGKQAANAKSQASEESSEMLGNILYFILYSDMLEKQRFFRLSDLPSGQ